MDLQSHLLQSCSRVRWCSFISSVNPQEQCKAWVSWCHHCPQPTPHHPESVECFSFFSWWFLPVQSIVILDLLYSGSANHGLQIMFSSAWTMQWGKGSLHILDTSVTPLFRHSHAQRLIHCKVGQQLSITGQGLSLNILPSQPASSLCGSSSTHRAALHWHSCSVLWPGTHSLLSHA